MIYLDNAATSLLKPDSVQYAVVQAMSTMSSVGRGAYAPADRAAKLCFACRERASQLFNVGDASHVVFTFNATHGLNIAINSLVKPGQRVCVSGYEHNSVMRPLNALGAKCEIVRTPLFDQAAMVQEFERRLRSCEAAVFTCVSNVFGFILPYEKMAEICKKQGKPFIIDASQAAGSLRIDFKALGADFIAMPGHKGLLGPQGTGILLCKNEAKPLLYGGSGSDSRLRTMPDYLPDRLEAGTHNVSGIAGLYAGMSYVLQKSPEALLKREQDLTDLFIKELGDVKAFVGNHENQSGVVSILPEGTSCEAVGDALARQGICVRTGLHCAPYAHETVGTIDSGTVRFSFSPFNSREEAITAARSARKICKKS